MDLRMDFEQIIGDLDAVVNGLDTAVAVVDAIRRGDEYEYIAPLVDKALVAAFQAGKRLGIRVADQAAKSVWADGYDEGYEDGYSDGLEDAETGGPGCELCECFGCQETLGE